MYRLRNATLIAAICASVLPASALAVDRCNAKFEFSNGTATTIEVVNRVVIRGNRGDYVEKLDRARELLGGARATTRKNRLQKVDDGTSAQFRIQIKRFHRGVRWSNDLKRRAYKIGAGFAGNFSNASLERIYREMGLILDVTCRDGWTIKFRIRSLPNTPANRTLVQRAHPGTNFANAGAARAIYRRYMDIE
ncbi:MAG: hypothetical protein H6934_12200 [Burkholderiaceae bacterium]|nr:hypothetical protein [Burkholderiaceae bacterium]